jgi:hypothetical protein
VRDRANRSKSGFGCAEAMTTSIGFGLGGSGGGPTPAKPASAGNLDQYNRS